VKYESLSINSPPSSFLILISPMHTICLGHHCLDRQLQIMRLVGQEPHLVTH
jgi:hypothetical protein